MIDIRTVEIVTPDLQRQTLVESNNKLKVLNVALVLLIAIGIVANTVNYRKQMQNKEK